MKTDLSFEESLKRERSKIFTADFLEGTLQSISHQRNCIEAIEKQIPKKITDIHVDEYYCPACGAENTLKFNYYCPTCGQKLSWSDEEWT